MRVSCDSPRILRCLGIYLLAEVFLLGLSERINHSWMVSYTMIESPAGYMILEVRLGMSGSGTEDYLGK